jgi:hypothetical protein
MPDGPARSACCGWHGRCSNHLVVTGWHRGGRCGGPAGGGAGARRAPVGEAGRGRAQRPADCTDRARRACRLPAACPSSRRRPPTLSDVAGDLGVMARREGRERLSAAPGRDLPPQAVSDPVPNPPLIPFINHPTHLKSKHGTVHGIAPCRSLVSTYRAAILGGLPGLRRGVSMGVFSALTTAVSGMTGAVLCAREHLRKHRQFADGGLQARRHELSRIWCRIRR